MKQLCHYKTHDFEAMKRFCRCKTIQIEAMKQEQMRAAA
jgi:hypothetical protein